MYGKAISYLCRKLVRARRQQRFAHRRAQTVCLFAHGRLGYRLTLCQLAIRSLAVCLSAHGQLSLDCLVWTVVSATNTVLLSALLVSTPQANCIIKYKNTAPILLLKLLCGVVEINLLFRGVRVHLNRVTRPSSVFLIRVISRLFPYNLNAAFFGAENLCC